MPHPRSLSSIHHLARGPPGSVCHLSVKNDRFPYGRVARWALLPTSPPPEPYVKVVLSYGSSLFLARFRTRLRYV
jgi:hypothetical protein